MMIISSYAIIGVYFCRRALVHDVLNASINMELDFIECMSIDGIICM